MTGTVTICLSYNILRDYKLYLYLYVMVTILMHTYIDHAKGVVQCQCGAYH